VSHTVLYIEDNADNVQLVRRMISRRGQTELLVATNGRDGIRAAVDEQPSLILLDNRLPDATGAQILRQLVAAEHTAAIPVVIVTGDSSSSTAGELLAIGAADFLAKPFDTRQFLTMLDRHLC
jgi:CheY-like chemotaxis protein